MKAIRYLKTIMLLVALSAAGSALWAQPAKFRVSGKVVDEGKVPVVGVTIIEKGTQNGTTTNVNGVFELQAASRKSILQVSFLGYQSVEVAAEAAGEIVLRESAQKIDDVVVIGYGSVTRKDLTGSVSQVAVGELEDAPIASITEALAGRVAGMQVSSSDGQPGMGQTIVIRGNNSLTQDNSPLYVVDGFIVEDFDPASVGVKDIESINILKDASSTAIYGARAANGVIVITTKKGKVGKPTVYFSASAGISGVSNRMEMMSAYEFVKYHYELREQLTTQRYLPGGRTLDYYKDVEATDWFDRILNPSPVTQIYDLSIRGGNDQTRYSISGAYYDMDGIIYNTGYGRYQGRIILDQRLGNAVKVGINANYSKKTAFGQTTAEGSTDYNISTYQLYNVLGYRPVAATSSGVDLEDDLVDDEIDDITDIRFNPVITNANEYKYVFTTNTSVNAYLEVKPIPSLTFLATGTMSLQDQRSESFHNSLTQRGSDRNPSNNRGQWGSISNYAREVWSNENTLTWNKVFGEVHSVNAVAGASFQKGSNETDGFTSVRVPNENLGVRGLDEGTPIATITRGSTYTMASFFGRVNYSYDSRYLFTATYRADGSSRFSPYNRWAYFPSGAVAWNFSEEQFVKRFPALSTGKFRASWGQTGNNRVSDYAYMSGLSTPIGVSYSFGNDTPSHGLVQENIGNMKLKWETTTQTDLGIDLGFFKDRITLTADIYKKVTDDLLLDADIPYTTGFQTAYMNVGKIENRGLELTLRTVNIDTRNFTWSTGFNISFNRNKILELANNQRNLFSFVSFESNYNNEPLYITQVGRPTGMFYGYVFDGVYQYEDFDLTPSGNYVLKKNMHTNGEERESIQPGDIKYRDLNGDGVVDAYDKTVIGRGQPLHVGGISNDFRYKGLRLSVFFQWSYGNDLMNANRLVFEGNTTVRNFVNQYKSYEDRWTPENPTNRNFRTGGQGPVGRYSTRVLEDGSYLRLKNVTLSYDLPEKWVQKIGMRSINVYVSGQNLWTWTGYSGFDPEVSVRNSVLTPGFDFSAYPMSRTVMAGIKMTFRSK